MDYLIDTNILLRFAIRTHPDQTIAKNAVQQLLENKSHLFLVPQNCIEFWNVITRRRDRNGFGLSPGDANELLQQIEQTLVVLPDIPVIYPRWRQLIVQFGVSGVQVHDARLVAAMLAHGISSLLTFNSSDFTRYLSAGIVAVTPHSLVI